MRPQALFGPLGKQVIIASAGQDSNLRVSVFDGFGDCAEFVPAVAPILGVVEVRSHNL